MWPFTSRTRKPMSFQSDGVFCQLRLTFCAERGETRGGAVPMVLTGGGGKVDEDMVAVASVWCYSGEYELLLSQHSHEMRVLSANATDSLKLTSSSAEARVPKLRIFSPPPIPAVRGSKRICKEPGLPFSTPDPTKTETETAGGCCRGWRARLM